MQRHLLGCWDDWLRAHWASSFATCETPLHIYVDLWAGASCRQVMWGHQPLPYPSPFFPSTPPRLTVFPVVFSFLPFPSIHSHSLKRRPLLCLGVLRSALAPPASSGRHGRKTVFGEFHAEISTLVAMIFRSFSGNKTNWGGLGFPRYGEKNCLCIFTIVIL